MMTDEEIEVVAAELAKAGGVSWYPGQESGPLKLVMDRYRDRARLVIATLERLRAAEQSGRSAKPNLGPVADEAISVGTLVLYRPPGDKRTYPCRVERLDGTRAYLVPYLPTCTGWVDLETLSAQATQ